MRKIIDEYPELEKVVFPLKPFNEADLKQQKETIKDTRLAQPLFRNCRPCIGKIPRIIRHYP